MLLAGEHIFIKKAWKNFPCAFRKTATAFIPAHFRRRPPSPGIRKDTKIIRCDGTFFRAASSGLRRSSGFPPPGRRRSIRAPSPPYRHRPFVSKLHPYRKSRVPGAAYGRGAVPAPFSDASALLPRTASSHNQKPQMLRPQEKHASRHNPPHPLFTKERFMRT